MRNSQGSSLGSHSVNDTDTDAADTDAMVTIPHGGRQLFLASRYNRCIKTSQHKPSALRSTLYLYYLFVIRRVMTSFKT